MPREQLDALQRLTAADLEGDAERLLGRCHFETLVMGKLQPGEARAIVWGVASDLGIAGGLKQLPWRAGAALPPGRTLWLPDGSDIRSEGPGTVPARRPGGVGAFRFESGLGLLLSEAGG